MNQTVPTINNTAVVVVTYNPGKDFIENIRRHIKVASLVIVVDNNSDNKDYLRYLTESNGIVFIEQDRNTGIAEALNIGIKRGLAEGKEWILTLDDDSLPNENILSVYAKFIKRYDNIGIIGTTFSDGEVEISRDIKCIDCLTVITSGSLHHKDVFFEIGYYEEKLVIDCVDFDYTIRVSTESGLTVKRVETPLIIHTLGAPIKKYGIVSSNHSSLRRYYWARNTVYLNKKYLCKVPVWILKKDFFFLRDIVFLILVEKGVLEKMKAIVKGIKDGLTF